MPLLGQLFLYKDILGVAVFLLGVCTLLYPILPYLIKYGMIVWMMIWCINKQVLYTLLLSYNILVSFSNSLILKSDFLLFYWYSTTMILFSNIAYDEYRGIVMGMSETIACITRCIVHTLYFFLFYRVQCFFPIFIVGR